MAVRDAPVVTALACRGRRHSSILLHFSPLKISPFPFCLQCKDFFKAGRGIYEDLCRRLPFYPSDFTDGTLHGDEAESSTLLCHSGGPLTVPRLSVTFCLCYVGAASVPLLGRPPIITTVSHRSGFSRISLFGNV